MALDSSYILPIHLASQFCDDMFNLSSLKTIRCDDILWAPESRQFSI